MEAATGRIDVSSSREIHHYDQVLERYETRTRQVKVKVGRSDMYVDKEIWEMGTSKINIAQSLSMTTRRRPMKNRFTERYQYTKQNTVLRSCVESCLSQTPFRPKSTAEWPPLPGPSKEWRENARQANYYIIVSEPNGVQHKEEIGFQQWEGLTEGSYLSAKKARIIGTYMGLAQ